MSQNQTPETPEPTPEASQPAAVDQTPFVEQPQRSRRTLWLGVGAGAAVVAVGLGGVALGAAIGGDHHERSVAFERNGALSGPAMGIGDRLLGDRDGDGPRMGGPLMGGVGPGSALHGELVFEDASGDYVTMTMQQGEVTEVDDTTITLASADGFTQTYAIDGETRAASPDATSASDGLSGIEAGDSVHVIAQLDGDAATAQVVVEGFDGLGGFGGFDGLGSQPGESA